MKGTPAPHGGELVDLLVPQDHARELRAGSREWPSWDLTPRQICDLELLMNGGFSPLRGFMTSRDHASVCSSMRLADGTLWPLPIALEVPAAVADMAEKARMVALRDEEGVMLAVLEVQDVWRPDLHAEAEAVYGSTDREHPGVEYLLRQDGAVYVGGRVYGIQPPIHHDFRDLRLGPREVRAEFARDGWRNVLAFQTRNPMHRAHFEMTVRAAKEVDANLLIHPAVGMTKPGDVDHYTRVRCYQALLGHYPTNSVRLALLPLAMRMAGPREALWHAIIRKNHGCTHFIVGRDHAGPGANKAGKPFYGAYEAQTLLRKHEGELGISVVPFQTMVYAENRDEFVPEDMIQPGERTLTISGTELRERLEQGRDVPKWFTFPEVASELRRTHPPRHKQGFTVFFTGLSGSGKSTIAKTLLVKLLEIGGRPITLLDGDIVRKNLSSELGFSREHRDLNILRIGYVASEITKNGGIALCAPIAPYDVTRREVRRSMKSLGGFVLVHVATPLEVCEQRDRKGLYAKARAGVVKEFTGISDPYEVPTDADVVLDTTDLLPEESAEMILLYLKREGYIGPPSP